MLRLFNLFLLFQSPYIHQYIVDPSLLNHRNKFSLQLIVASCYLLFQRIPGDQLNYVVHVDLFSCQDFLEPLDPVRIDPTLGVERKRILREFRPWSVEPSPPFISTWTNVLADVMPVWGAVPWMRCSPPATAKRASISSCASNAASAWSLARRITTRWSKFRRLT